jgi:hypothetical protein
VRGGRTPTEAGLAPDRRPQTGRTVPDARVCAGCGVPTRLCIGCGVPIDHKRPQARFCHDRCRATTHRREREERLRMRLEALEIAAGNLHEELHPPASTRPHNG